MWHMQRRTLWTHDKRIHGAPRMIHTAASLDARSTAGHMGETPEVGVCLYHASRTNALLNVSHDDGVLPRTGRKQEPRMSAV